jgi:hypothetical protein
VKEVMVKLEIMPYDEETGEGELRYIQAVVTTQHNTAIPVGERYPKAKVQLSLVWNARDEKALAAELLPEFAEVRHHSIFMTKNFSSIFPKNIRGAAFIPVDSELKKSGAPDWITVSSRFYHFNACICSI